jgi:hypothetical protein
MNDKELAAWDRLALWAIAAMSLLPLAPIVLNALT